MSFSSSSSSRKRAPGLEDEVLTPPELAVLREAKRALGRDLQGLPRDSIIQFIRGYEGEKTWQETAISHMRTVAAWRVKEGCDDIVTPEKTPPKRAEFERMWQSGAIGEDAFGHPIIVECLGKIPAHEFRESFSEELFLRHCVYNKECLRRLCIHQSHAKGRRIYKFVVILDMDGLSGQHTSSNFIHLVKTYISAFSNYYPESLHKLYMINVPWIFKAVWSLIKPMLHPLTAAKIRMLGHGQEMSREMAADELHFSSNLSLCEAIRSLEPMSGMLERLDLLATGASPFVPEQELRYHEADADDAGVWEEVQVDFGAVVPYGSGAGGGLTARERGVFPSACTAASPSPAATAAADLGAAAVTGTLDCDTLGRTVFFALCGRALSWYGTEAALTAALRGDPAEAVRGQSGRGQSGSMTLVRVHGGEKHLLLYGTHPKDSGAEAGCCLVVRRGTGSAMLEVAVTRYAGRDSPAIGSGEFVALPLERAAPTPAPAAKGGVGTAVARALAAPLTALSASESAAKAAVAAADAAPEQPGSPGLATAMVPAAPPSAGSGVSTSLVLALVLALCAANVAILGQWRLELTWA